MPAATLKQFLDSHHVKYVTLTHSTAYTAQEVAAAAHVSGRSLAKTVIVVIDGVLAMVVVPAAVWVSMSRVKRFSGGGLVTLATEEDFLAAFPGCEPGTMPPFGNLYGLPVYVDESLEGSPLTFSAGSHRELITVGWEDFVRLVQPMTGRLSSLRPQGV